LPGQHGTCQVGQRHKHEERARRPPARACTTPRLARRHAGPRHLYEPIDTVVITTRYRRLPKAPCGGVAPGVARFRRTDRGQNPADPGLGYEAKWSSTCANACGQGRDRTGDLPLFRRTLIPTELPGPTAPLCLAAVATLTGLEPATSAVTGRRANQLR